MIDATLGRFVAEIFVRSTLGLSVGEWSALDREATLGRCYEDGRLV